MRQRAERGLNRAEQHSGHYTNLNLSTCFGMEGIKSLINHVMSALIQETGEAKMAERMACLNSFT